MKRNVFSVMASFIIHGEPSWQRRTRRRRIRPLHRRRPQRQRRRRRLRRQQPRARRRTARMTQR